MHESFQTDIRIVMDILYLFQRKFPGQHRLEEPHFLHFLCPGGIVYGHLSGSGQGQFRAQPFQIGGGSHILNDNGISPGLYDLPGRLQKGFPFLIPNKGIQSHMNLHPPAVAIFYRRFKPSGAKVLGIAAGIESPRPQINGIGAAAHSGCQGIGVARRSQDLHHG